MHVSLRLITLLLIVAGCAAPLSSHEQESYTGSLAELRNKPKVWLVVRRGALVDASGADASIISEVYREGSHRTTFPRTFNLIARRLNKYMKEHGSISGARSLTDADFILFFNVLEIRRPLGTPYAYGELFVILNQKPSPRILWKTRSSGKFADDAVGDFISELKAVRGEK